jgi:hypothetical protein
MEIRSFKRRKKLSWYLFLVYMSSDSVVADGIRIRVCPLDVCVHAGTSGAAHCLDSGSCIALGMARGTPWTVLTTACRLPIYVATDRIMELGWPRQKLSRLLCIGVRVQAIVR